MPPLPAAHAAAFHRLSSNASYRHLSPPMAVHRLPGERRRRPRGRDEGDPLPGLLARHRLRQGHRGQSPGLGHPRGRAPLDGGGTGQASHGARERRLPSPSIASHRLPPPSTSWSSCIRQRSAPIDRRLPAASSQYSTAPSPAAHQHSALPLHPHLPAPTALCSSLQPTAGHASRARPCRSPRFGAVGMQTSLG